MSDVQNKATDAVVNPAVKEYTLAEQAAFATMSQADLTEAMTVTDAEGNVFLPSVSGLTTAICTAEMAPKGAARLLAARINIELPEVEGSQHWFETISTESTSMAKAFEPMRKAITNTARARNHSNAAQLVKQVKEQGRLLRGGAAPETKDQQARDTFKRLSEELLALYKFLNSAQQDSVIKAHHERAKIQAGLLHITNALTAMEIKLDED